MTALDIFDPVARDVVLMGHDRVGDRVGVGAQSSSCLRPECEECSSGFENHCYVEHVDTYNSKYPDGSVSKGRNFSVFSLLLSVSFRGLHIGKIFICSKRLRSYSQKSQATSAHLASCKARMFLCFKIIIDCRRASLSASSVLSSHERHSQCYHKLTSSISGGYGDYWRGPSHFVFKIPDAIPSEDAAPMLCGGITVYSPLKKNGAGPGKKVGIVGVGGLGHFGILYAKALEADKVVAISRSNAKKDDALKVPPLIPLLFHPLCPFLSQRDGKGKAKK